MTANSDAPNKPSPSLAVAENRGRLERSGLLCEERLLGRRAANFFSLEETLRHWLATHGDIRTTETTTTEE